MLGRTLAGVLLTSAQCVKHTRHTEFTRVPCDRSPTRSLPRTVTTHDARTGCGSTPHTSTRPEPPSLYDGSSPLHSKARHNALVPARVPGPVPRCATMRQLQFQSQSCDEVHKSQDANRAARRMNTRALFVSPHSTFETTSRQVPFHSLVRLPRFLRDKQSIFPFTNTNSQSPSSNAGNLRFKTSC